MAAPQTYQIIAIDDGDELFVGGGARDGSSGKLFVINRKTGKVRSTIDLSARVTECGLAAAGGHLYISTEDGTVHKK